MRRSASFIMVATALVVSSCLTFGHDRRWFFFLHDLILDVIRFLNGWLSSSDCGYNPQFWYAKHLCRWPISILHAVLLPGGGSGCVNRFLPHTWLSAASVNVNDTEYYLLCNSITAFSRWCDVVTGFYVPCWFSCFDMFCLLPLALFYFSFAKLAQAASCKVKQRCL